MTGCNMGTAGLKGLLEAEYAFGQRARSSVRDAFLDYLADDSLILQPAPIPGRAFYAAAGDDAGKLEWYPAVADLAGSGDLGFTTGPWIYTASPGGKQIQGHFLSIWKLGKPCRWQVSFDGGVSHAVAGDPEPKLTPEQFPEMAPGQSPGPLPGAPPQELILEDAADQAIRDFRETSLDEGFAPALRTYARTTDFIFYSEGEAPMHLASATRYLSGHPSPEAWKEYGYGRSSDSSLFYSVGVFGPSSHRRYAYVQIWQYATRAANWGLRVLLIKPMPPSTSP